MADTNITENKYSYTIKLEFVLDGKNELINDTGIAQVIINYDYFTGHMPLMLMRCKISTDTYNRMIRNQDKGKLSITISKFIDGAKSPKKYIQKSLSYYLPSSVTQGSPTTSAKKKDGDDINAYVDCSLGLLDVNMVVKNKQLINNEFKNTNAISIINHYTQSFQMIIEPFDNLDTMKLCYIPPLEGITRLLEYLDSVQSFYTTPYRFFMDYKYTYLLSMKGTGIDINDGTYKTVQITVQKDDEEYSNNSGKFIGMGINSKQKIYQFRISDKMVVPSTNDTTDKLFNKVYAVDYKGNTKTVTVDTNSEVDTKAASNMKIIRVNNSNFGITDEIKSAAEGTGKTISVNIADVDASIFVPYKEFIFTFEKKEDKVFNGVYNLCSKKEVYASNGNVDNEGEFKCIVNLLFKKKS